LAALEAVLLLVLIAVTGTRVPAAVFVVAKFPFCAWLLRRRAGAFFALLLWEISGVGIALFAPRIAFELRLLELVIAVTVIGLLWASARFFPSAELPAR
jgi:hypothetical protein